jgi:polynucleotide 5'-hydroxyl-kinase GRC3/NOL9
VPTVALYFVGAISPRGHLIPMVAGTKRLVDGARRLDVGQVIIDTCGYISADGGQALKYYQIDLIDPDLVVCLQRGTECEPLLLAFRYGRQPRILRLRASPACRRRSPDERRRHRERAMRTYLARPRVVSLSWTDLNLVAAPIGCGAALDVKRDGHLQQRLIAKVLWAEQRDDELHVVLQSPLCTDAMMELTRAFGARIRSWLAEELCGTLLGLLDEAGETVGIGIIQRINFAHHRLEVLTAEGVEGIRGVHWSRTRMGPRGELSHAFSTTR